MKQSGIFHTIKRPQIRNKRLKQIEKERETDREREEETERDRKKKEI